MKHCALIFVLAGWPALAQTPTLTPTMPPGPEISSEQTALNNAIAGLDGSPIDFIRALVRHLEKYPSSAKRATIEEAIMKAAMEGNENRWIAAYGEAYLARQATADLAVLERVARALLETENAETGARALAVARRYETTVRELGAQHPEGHLTDGQWALEAEKGLSRAYSLQAHALGNMGKLNEAAAAARTGWEHWPTGEAAREAAHWLDKQNKPSEAIVWYANAFAVDDPKTTTEQRAKDRARLGELYAKVHKSDKGLAELLLTAYDGAVASRSAHIKAQKAKDPNIEATSFEEFQIQAVHGPSLPAKSLAGKTVVLDFWATWCVPCIAQHPLIERVKKKFAGNDNVVFLALDSDDDRSLVPGFIQQQKWEGPIYYEGGLASMMKIGSLPTLLILDGKGHIASRMAGYVPEKFESMLEQRILDTRESQVR